MNIVVIKIGGINMAKKNAAILVEKEINEIEFWYPYYRAIEEGMDITIVGPEAGETYSNKEAEMSSEEALKKDWDLLIIPGGSAPNHMIKDPSMLELTKKMNENNLPIAAICHGTIVLCEADIVDGIKMTCPGDVNERAEKAGAILASDEEWKEKHVFVDGNIITSRGPVDLPYFSQAIFS